MTVKRGQKFFPQLTGLANAIRNGAEQNIKHTGPVNKLNRADEDIQERLDRQAAKLARRAKLAGTGPKQAIERLTAMHPALGMGYGKSAAVEQALQEEAKQMAEEFRRQNPELTKAWFDEAGGLTPANIDAVHKALDDACEPPEYPSLQDDALAEVLRERTGSV